MAHLGNRTPASILINEGNLNSGILHKERELIHSGSTWHKVYVRNALSYDRDFVLRVLMDTVYPYDFIPVKYAVEGENVSFLLKNCGKALNEICTRNLIVANPKSALPFKVAILLQFAQDVVVDVQTTISIALRKRFQISTKTMNLDAFHTDSALHEFCPLSQPKLLYFVLHLCKLYDIVHLKLSNNNIELTKPFDALGNLKSITSIDIRGNNIKSFGELAVLKSWPITELFLEENPLCENCAELTYISEIRHFCPKLTKLDGCAVSNTNGIPPFRRNYLCDREGFDLVEQFIEHYFTMYDSHCRSALEGLYHKQAQFSITAQYLHGHPSFANAKLVPYISVAHNLKNFSDLSKASAGIFIGSKEITRVISQLPKTEHDPFTFTVDLCKYSELGAVLTVTGVFREPAEALLEIDRVLGFSRTFVLIPSANDEFSIINEQLHVTNATGAQQLRAFKQTRSGVAGGNAPLVPSQNHVNVPSARDVKEELEFIDTLTRISHLNAEWSRKCLEETKYNLSAALVLFVDLYKLDKIPESAFLSADELAKLNATPFYTDSAIPHPKPSPTLTSSTDTNNPSLPSSTIIKPSIVDNHPVLVNNAPLDPNRGNPFYTDDPFDTSRTYRQRYEEPVAPAPPTLSNNSNERRPTSVRNHRWSYMRSRSRERKRSRSRSRSRSREKVYNRGSRTRSRIRRSRSKSRERSRSRRRSLSNDRKSSSNSVVLILDDEKPAEENAQKEEEECAVQLTNEKATIGMEELAACEKKLNSLKGTVIVQQNMIKKITDKLFLNYPNDVKVWLLTIGTYYKHNVIYKAREMKNKAIKAFQKQPEIGFQIRLAAAQMEMEFVTGASFSLNDKKVGEQHFVSIMQLHPTNVNILRIFVQCLLKRYASDEKLALNIYTNAMSKLKITPPGGVKEFFDSHKNNST